MSISAYISGRLGKALVLDNDQRWVIGQDMPQHEPAPGEISELLSDAAEVKCFSTSSMDTVRAHLDNEIMFQDALFLFLSGCDPGLSLSTRIMCGQELELLLQSKSLTERLTSRLLSKPMPVEIRANRKETVSLFSSFDLFAASLRRIFGLQECCDEVYAAWKEVASRVPPDGASELEAELIEDGTMASVVEALSTRDLHSFNAHFVSQSLRRRNPSLDQAARDVLSGIRESLRHCLSRAGGRQRVLPLNRRRTRRAGQSVDVIDEAMQRARGADGSSRLSSFEAKTRVDKQIAGIAKEFFSGREDLAEKYIADLVNFQLSHSEQEHLAKSFCNLAASALDANMLEMADRLSRYAVDLGINDPVVITTRAEVLKDLGRFAASLETFNEAKARFPNSEYAWVGIADVLKEMGKHELSLSSYLEAQERFPDSPVPLNGCVSVLRAQGRRTEAIQYALKVVDRFPDDSVSRSSLASALRDRGRYYQAVRQYKAALRLDGRSVVTILGYVGTLCLTDAGAQGALEYLEDRLRKMPDNAGLLNAKANYLRRAGILPESLAVAERLMAEQPTYTPARFTCAATLVAMGKNEEARKILPATEELRSELDWLGPRIYAMTLAAEGRFPEAAEKLEFALGLCPWRKQLVKLRTTLGYVQMKLGKLTESIRTLEQDMRLLDDSTHQVRLVLLGQAHVMRGNYAVANTLLRNMVNTKDLLLESLQQRSLISIQSPHPGAGEIPDRVELQLLLAA
jgi:tetratricopeptide (TPR) repeat protein